MMTGMMVFYRVPVGWSLLWLPVSPNAGLLAFAVGMALAVMGTFKRDFITPAPLLTQLWLFATPVAYPSNLLSEPWRTLYGLNPMAGVVEGFRWALLGSRPPGLMLDLSAAVAVLLLLAARIISGGWRRHSPMWCRG